jgi:hypothetical protein
MGSKLFNHLRKLTYYLFAGNRNDSKQKGPTFQEAIIMAKQEWECARNRFNQVTEPDLIENAIYAEKAALGRYMYLLKLARQRNSNSRTVDLNQVRLQEIHLQNKPADLTF